MQTKVLSAPSGCLLWRCLFSWQRNGAGGIGKTVRNSKPVDHSNLHHKIRFCSRPMPRAAPPAPPNAPKSCRTDQGPNRDAPAAAGPEQTGLADRAPAARSAAAAGSPQAARWQVRAAVSDPNCSRPAPGRPSGSGSAGAMSRVSRALREQRGGGCVRLDERRASRAACLSCGLCAQLAWASRYCGTTVSKLWAAGRGRAGEDGCSSPARVLPKRQFGRPLVPRPAAARLGLRYAVVYIY